MTTLFEHYGKPVSIYTRAQAIDDGFLVDVSDTAKEAGFSIPMALSRNAWDRMVALPHGYEGWQDEAGRLWDVVWMASRAALAHPGKDRISFPVCVRRINRRKRDGGLDHHAPVLAIGGDDDGGPCLTVMFPEDD